MINHLQLDDSGGPADSFSEVSLDITSQTSTPSKGQSTHKIPAILPVVNPLPTNDVYMCHELP